MYDRILVPLDGSELAEVTLWYASRLAGRLKSALTLLYVATPDDLASPHLHECYLSDVVARIKPEADEAGGAKVAIDFKILRGDPAEEIVDYADKAKTDLIILSTQGKSGIRRWPLGNVANKVVSATRKQVLLIRAKGPQPDVYRDRLVKVLVPVDGSRESESVLRFVTYMASELNLGLTVLHMWPSDYMFYPSIENVEEFRKGRKKQEQYASRLEARLKKEGLNAEAIFKEVPVGEEGAEIIKLAEEGKYSMVAMATHGRSGFGRWIFGSVATRVLNEGSTPLLLVRPVKGKK